MATTIDPTEFTIEWHIGDLHLFAEVKWHLDQAELAPTHGDLADG